MTEEQAFVQRALASVEKAEKSYRIKRILVSMVVLVSAVSWFAFKPGSNVDNAEWSIAILAGMLICTAKIQSQISKNTKSVLQAIADLQRDRA